MKTEKTTQEVATETLFCLSLLAEGPAVIARVTGRYVEMREVSPDVRDALTRAMNPPAPIPDRKDDQ